jgi:uncharacterized phage-associated protein
VLRDRHPGLPIKKLHKLLYYCQGHHLAAMGTPLFEERISAWDMGPVVGELWFAERTAGQATATRELNEAELNTVGYVLSRYGALTGRDLENLTHREQPWLLADAGRQPQQSVPIELEWIRQYFGSVATAGIDDEDDVVLDAADVAEWLGSAAERLTEPAILDDPAALAERFERLRGAARGDV